MEAAFSYGIVFEKFQIANEDEKTEFVKNVCLFVHRLKAAIFKQVEDSDHEEPTKVDQALLGEKSVEDYKEE